MNIIKQKWIFLNLTLEVVPKQIGKLYQFGTQVLALRKVESLRANARISGLKWNTAKSKIYRLTGNIRLLSVFPLIMKAVGIVRSRDIIAIDFSDFGNNMQVLMFAKQTKKGRTIPVYFEVIRYPITKGSQNIFIINAIKNLTEILGFKSKFVFDRGFACPSIIEFLAKERYKFYIRIKKGKSVIVLKTKKKIFSKDANKNDLKVIAYDKKLRLIVSDKSKNNNEPWYIITNNFRSTRKRIIEIYYHRFEIEEFFRDAKRLLGLEYVQFKKQTSLQITLWFVILGIWFLWSLEEKEYERSQRDKMQLSIVRYYFEKIHSEIVRMAEDRFMNKFFLDSG